MEVEDLFTDLADGIKLLKLLEIISGEKLGKPNSGRMRVHKIENVNKSLAFLHTKVKQNCDPWSEFVFVQFKPFLIDIPAIRLRQLRHTTVLLQINQWKSHLIVYSVHGLFLFNCLYWFLFAQVCVQCTCTDC